MRYIDFHCDTLMYAYNDDKDKDLYENNFMVDFKSLNEVGVLAQFFAIFMLDDEIFKEIGREKISDDSYIKSSVAILEKKVNLHDDIVAMAYSYDDFLKNRQRDKTSVFLTIEDGRSIKSIEKLEEYYDLGIRLISLTWNYENVLAFPNSRDSSLMNRGLKDFGIAIVERMNQLGMLIDVSHLSDGGFYDVLKYSKKPFIASHSNARALTNHPRNLTDEMIKALADRGGLVGLNFCPQFLNSNPSNEKSKISDMLRHIKHIINVGGEDILAIGSDFDGIEGDLEIRTPRDMDKLFEALAKEGFSEKIIEKIGYKNAYRIMAEVF